MYDVLIVKSGSVVFSYFFYSFYSSFSYCICFREALCIFSSFCISNKKKKKKKLYLLTFLHFLFTRINIIFVFFDTFFSHHGGAHDANEPSFVIASLPFPLIHLEIIRLITGNCLHLPQSRSSLSLRRDSQPYHPPLSEPFL